MNIKNKILGGISAVITIVLALSGCTSKVSEEKVAQDVQSDKLSVVCTIFPQYDWVRQILGDNSENVDLTLLLDNGVDLHSYQPTADDIVKISEADLFIYVGGESDAWVDDVLKSANNKDMIVLDLMDILNDSVKEEEVIEGMQAEEEGEEGEEEEIEYDEHVWLSLKNAEIICNSISQSLQEIDSNAADTYAKNCNDYISKLNALDKEYEKTVVSAERKVLIFGDRFPFRYMVDDYGLKYYAAFVGCSAETEASFETITFLANKVNELDIPSVMVIENSDKKIAQTIIDNTDEKNQDVLVMDSMQSVTSNDVDNGENYLNIMNSNLETLKKALN